MPIGKTRDEKGEWQLNDEPEEVTVDGEHAASDRAFLRKEVVGKRLKCADADTAKALEVPFDGVEAFDVPPPPLPATNPAHAFGAQVEGVTAPLMESIGEVTAAIRELPPSDPNAVLVPRADGDESPLVDALSPPAAPEVTTPFAPSRRGKEK